MESSMRKQSQHVRDPEPHPIFSAGVKTGRADMEAEEAAIPLQAAPVVD
jgi:hypothetical protein